MNLKDCILFAPTYNRFPLTRTSLISMLAFGGLHGLPIHIIDDGSEDGQLRVWLASLGASNRIRVTWRGYNSGIGACYRDTVALCPESARAVFWLASDLCLGPNSLRNLLGSYIYWSERGERIGMLCAFTHPRRDQPRPDKAQALSHHRWTDTGLILFPGDVWRRYGDRVYRRRTRVLSRMTHRIQDAGYVRVLCHCPKIDVLHMGQPFALIAHEPDSVPGWVGVPPAAETFPENVDRDWFIANYPKSACELAHRILTEYVQDDSLKADIARADEQSQHLG